MSITIVIPTFNRLDLFKETFASLNRQTDERWLSIVVDDGSTDEFLKEISKIVQNDTRTLLIERPPHVVKGASSCRNFGLKQVKTKWVFFLDSDDLLNDRFVESFYRSVENTTFDFVALPTKLFRKKPDDMSVFLNRSFEKREVLQAFLEQNNPWITIGVIWQVTFLEKINGFDEELLSWQDWDLSIRALLKSSNYNIYNLGSFPHNYYRQSDIDSISSSGYELDKIKNRNFLFLKTYNNLKEAAYDNRLQTTFAKLIFFNAMKYKNFNLGLYKPLLEDDLLSWGNYFFWIFYAKLKKINRPFIHLLIRICDFIAYKILGYHLYDFPNRTFKRYKP